MGESQQTQADPEADTNKEIGKIVSEENAEGTRSLADEFRLSVEEIFAGEITGFYNAANDLRKISHANAIEVFYRIAIDHGVRDALLNYGYFLQGEKRYSEALQWFLKAHAEGDAKASFAIGQTHLQLEDYAEAIRWLESSGDEPFIPLRLAQAYRGVGDEESALRVLIQSAETSSESAVELVLSGHLGLHDSIVLLEKHLGNGEMDVLIPLANLHAEVGDYPRSVELLRRSVALGEPHAAHNLQVTLLEYEEKKSEAENGGSESTL